MQDALQRLAQPGGVRAQVGNLVEFAVMYQRRLTPEDVTYNADILACLAQWLAIGQAVPALDDLRAGKPQAEQKASAAQLSSVIAVIAVLAGVRAGICMMAVPR